MRLTGPWAGSEQALDWCRRVLRGESVPGRVLGHGEVDVTLHYRDVDGTMATVTFPKVRLDPGGDDVFAMDVDVEEPDDLPRPGPVMAHETGPQMLRLLITGRLLPDDDGFCYIIDTRPDEAGR